MAKSAKLTIPTAEVFEPLLHPARYKGGWGGRGSGKSHFFAGLMAEDAVRFPSEAGEGLRGVCIREIQKTLKHSAKSLIEAKLNSFRLGEKDGFKIFNDTIQTPGDGVIIFQGMQDHTADSIKSLEGFHRAWGEESQTLSQRSIDLLTPTIRWEDLERNLASELWFSWNPRRKADPVDLMLRQRNMSESSVVKANWSDNPWFPKVLDKDRLNCLKNNPDQYEHIWEGGYITVAEGAYFARHLAEARKDGRIGRVSADPLMTIRLFCDIGGTGAKSDNFAIWAAQFIGQEIRVIDYYESQGQPIGAHLAWMRSKGYTPDFANVTLPHDGSTNDRIHDVSYESAFEAAGYKVSVIPNQGKGAASARIEEARRLFPSMWINEETCKGGLDALGWYHEKKDEQRGIGLGPEHDWASHGADAFGLMCVAHEPPTPEQDFSMPEPQYAGGGGGWMT